MLRFTILTCLFLGAVNFCSMASPVKDSLKLFGADHPYIQYTGRIDFSNPVLPRFWQPGVYISVNFTGLVCEVILNDVELCGRNHNYLQVVIDGKAMRLQTKVKEILLKSVGIYPKK